MVFQPAKLTDLLPCYVNCTPDQSLAYVHTFLLSVVAYNYVSIYFLKNNRGRMKHSRIRIYMSAPRTKSNPREFLCRIWLIWSELPHSSFSATKPAYRELKTKKTSGNLIIYLPFSVYFPHQHNNLDFQEMHAALYFSSISETGSINSQD